MPLENWLENAVTCMIEKKCDLLAGHYNVFSNSDLLKDQVYGLLYLNNGKNVSKKYGVTAGNLFVSASVFENIGSFEDQINTGNDIKWTKRALKAGYEIHYCENATINYPGQSYNQLVQSVRKYSLGIIQNQSTRFEKIGTIIRYALPMRPSTFTEALKHRELQDLPIIDKVYLWWIIWKIKAHLARHSIKHWILVIKNKSQ